MSSSACDVTPSNVLWSPYSYNSKYMCVCVCVCVYCVCVCIVCVCGMCMCIVCVCVYCVCVCVLCVCVVCVCILCVCGMCMCTVYREIFAVKNFSRLSVTAKISRTIFFFTTKRGNSLPDLRGLLSSSIPS